MLSAVTFHRYIYLCFDWINPSILAVLAIGADLLDTTGKLSINHENNLEEIKTVFELSTVQQTYTEMNKQSLYIREKYHSMHESMWDAGYTSDFTRYPERYGCCYACFDCNTIQDFLWITLELSVFTCWYDKMRHRYPWSAGPRYRL